MEETQSILPSTQEQSRDIQIEEEEKTKAVDYKENQSTKLVFLGKSNKVKLVWVSPADCAYGRSRLVQDLFESNRQRATEWLSIVKRAHLKKIGQKHKAVKQKTISVEKWIRNPDIECKCVMKRTAKTPQGHCETPNVSVIDCRYACEWAIEQDKWCHIVWGWYIVKLEKSPLIIYYRSEDVVTDLPENHKIHFQLYVYHDPFSQEELSWTGRAHVYHTLGLSSVEERSVLELFQQKFQYQPEPEKTQKLTTTTTTSKAITEKPIPQMLNESQNIQKHSELSDESVKMFEHHFTRSRSPSPPTASDFEQTSPKKENNRINNIIIKTEEKEHEEADPEASLMDWFVKQDLSTPTYAHKSTKSKKSKQSKTLLEKKELSSSRNENAKQPESTIEQKRTPKTSERFSGNLSPPHTSSSLSSSSSSSSGQSSSTRIAPVSKTSLASSLPSRRSSAQPCSSVLFRASHSASSSSQASPRAVGSSSPFSKSTPKASLPVTSVTSSVASLLLLPESPATHTSGVASDLLTRSPITLSTTDRESQIERTTPELPLGLLQDEDTQSEKEVEQKQYQLFEKTKETEHTPQANLKSNKWLELDDSNFESNNDTVSFVTSRPSDLLVSHSALHQHIKQRTSVGLQPDFTYFDDESVIAPDNDYRSSSSFSF
jgi:hypothetical protein